MKLHFYFVQHIDHQSSNPTMYQIIFHNQISDLQLEITNTLFW